MRPQLAECLTLENSGVLFRFEICPTFEVVNQSDMRREPSQFLSRHGARGHDTHSKEQPYPAKMLSCLVLRFARQWHVQAAADHFRDLSRGHSIVPNAVIDASG